MGVVATRCMRARTKQVVQKKRKRERDIVRVVRLYTTARAAPPPFSRPKVKSRVLHHRELRSPVAERMKLGEGGDVLLMHLRAQSSSFGALHTRAYIEGRLQMYAWSDKRCRRLAHSELVVCVDLIVRRRACWEAACAGGGKEQTMAPPLMDINPAWNVKRALLTSVTWPSCTTQKMGPIGGISKSR